MIAKHMKSWRWMWPTWSAVILAVASLNLHAAEGLSRSLASARPGDVRLAVTGSIAGPLEDVRAALERVVGHPLVIEYGSARGNLKTQILGGQGFEVAILLPDVTDELRAAGKVTSTYTDIARVQIGIGIRGEVPPVDVSTPATLKAAILGAKALEWSATGVAIQTVNAILDTLDIRDRVAATWHPSRQAVPVPLAPGEYELHVFPLSEIIDRKVARNMGPVIPALQRPQVIRAAISADTPDPASAKAVIEFLQRPEFAAALAAHGMTPMQQPPLQRPRPPPGTEAVIEKVRDNLYVATTGGPSRTNVTFFITQDHGVVMFDTGNPGWGEVWLAALRKITDKPLTHVFLTHDHADHSGSLIELGNPLVRVAQENVRQSLAQAECVERTGCQFFKGENSAYLPNKTFANRQTLFSGKDQVILHHFGRSHTNGDAVYEIPSLGVVLVGDLLAWRGVPRVMVDDNGSVAGYPQVLAQMTKTLRGVRAVITGHSVVMTWQDLLEFREFVADYVGYVHAAHDAGKSVEAVMAGLSARLAGYKPCGPTVTRAAELQRIDCRFRTDYAALNAAILYDELDGRASSHGSQRLGQ